MDEGIDGGCFGDLDKNDLHRLGISQFKDKRDIYNAIKDLMRNDNKKQDTECVVCMDDIVSHAFVPCGHLCLCLKCKDLIKETCPVCQDSFESIIKIYS